MGDEEEEEEEEEEASKQRRNGVRKPQRRGWDPGILKSMDGRTRARRRGEKPFSQEIITSFSHLPSARRRTTDRRRRRNRSPGREPSSKCSSTIWAVSLLSSL